MGGGEGKVREDGKVFGKGGMKEGRSRRRISWGEKKGRGRRRDLKRGELGRR